MKKSIAHLSERRQAQIEQIIKVIIDFADPEKIILYGSRASGKETEDSYVKNGIRYYYTSDYDIAVITNKTNLKKFELEQEIQKKLKVKPDVNAEMYDIEFFNNLLKSGEPFYVTIYEDGILVYDNGGVDLIKPEPLSMEQVLANAQKHYDYWISLISQYYNLAQESLNESIALNRKPNVAIWMLYQAIEGLYSVLLLVFTGNKPKIHNLYKYRDAVKAFSIELNAIFPFPTKDKYEQNLFDLLKRAYIGAKYKQEYEITIEEVKEINRRIEKMTEIIQQICLNRMESYRNAIK